MPSLAKLAILSLAVPLMVVVACCADNVPAIGWWRRRFIFDRWFEALTFVGSIVCLLLSIILVRNISEQPVLFSFLIFDLAMDALSVYFIFLVNIIALFASWNALTSPSGKRSLLFNVLVNLFHFTMLLVPLVDNLVVLWIAVESTTLVSTLLVSFRDEKDSWEAAWKYLIVTSTGIIFALLGTVFLANGAKELLRLIPENQNQVMNWSFLMDHAGQLSSDFVKLSFLFILVGYGTKAGFAPMHTWLPDGHGEAPAPISALLSGVLLKSALYAILRFAMLTNSSLNSRAFTSSLLLATGLISLLLAVPFILQERNRFKRVLAYHSLEHMGIIAFGLGIGGEIALFGALLHALNHAVTKSLMFLAFGNVMRRYAEDDVGQQQIANVLRRMPITGGVLALGGLALVGTPPFNIFLSELIILWGSLASLKAEANTGPAWFTILAVALFMISTTLIFYGLIRHLARVLMQHSPENIGQAQAPVVSGDLRLKETRSEAAPLLLLTALVVVTGLFIWPPLATVLAQSVAIVGK